MRTKFRFTGLLMAGLLWGSLPSFGQTAVSGFDVRNMDQSVKPGDDFYRYINGNWMKNNPIPDDKSRFGAFDQLAELNNLQLKEIVDMLLKKTYDKGTTQQKIADFFASGMDTVSIQKQGIQPLAKIFKMIDGAKNKKALINVIAQLYGMGLESLFDVYGDQDSKNSSQVIAQISQSGISLPDRDYYLNTNKRSVEIREAYQKHIEKMMQLSGLSAEAAAKAAKTILGMETKIAGFSMSRLEQRDPNAIYHKMPVADLQKMLSEIDLDTYLTTMGAPKVAEINVAQPEFFKGLNQMIQSVDLADWKTYLKWKMLHTTAGLLSSPFETENFNFYGKFLSGRQQMEKRWKKVLGVVSNNLGEAIGQIYVEKYFPAESKAKMVKLVENLKIAYAARIQKLEWMQPETKTKALEKLAAIVVKVGYPDKWRDYSKLEIKRESFFENTLNAYAFGVKRNLEKIGKPVDRTEWGMSPQTVNAYYSPTMNEIVFPAGILQPPFFDVNADDAINYGAIGVVIGHEITHGFDDEGHQFDKDGNLKNWWTAKDSIEYVKRTTSLEQHYNSFVAIDSMHIDGKLTLGENLSDNGGMIISYDALMLALKGQKLDAKIDGFTPSQRFFMAYAQVWRQNIRPKELMRRLKEDVHSPGEWRVNAGVFNIAEFYKAFDIKPTDKLYLKEELRAKVW